MTWFCYYSIKVWFGNFQINYRWCAQFLLGMFCHYNPHGSLSFDVGRHTQNIACGVVALEGQVRAFPRIIHDVVAP